MSTQPMSEFTPAKKKQKRETLEQCTIEMLPDELLIRIFSRLDFPQILTLRLVNRHWSFVVYKTPLRVDLEHFLSTHGNVTALSSLLTGFKHIMHLEMGINELASVLPIVKNLTTLKKFSSLHPVTLSEFSHLVQFRHMTTLLVTLEVEPDQDSYELNKYLSHFVNLKCLTLSSDTEPLNIDISILSTLSKLTCLSLDNFSLSGLTPNCKPLQNLKALSLSYGTMESSYLDWFIKPNVRQLEILELIHIDLLGETLTMKYLRHLQKLKTFHFQLKKISTETFDYVIEGIMNCTKMKELGLYCPSEEANFQVQKLSGLVHLKSLTLSGFIEDVALKNIGNFGMLHSLALESEVLTNEAIAHINKIANLKFLDIQNTNIHDVNEIAEIHKGVSISMCH